MYKFLFSLPIAKGTQQFPFWVDPQGNVFAAQFTTQQTWRYWASAGLFWFCSVSTATVLTVHIRHWASAGFIAAKLYGTKRYRSRTGPVLELYRQTIMATRYNRLYWASAGLIAENHNGKTVHSLYCPSAGLIAANHNGKTILSLYCPSAGLDCGKPLTARRYRS